MAQLPRKAKKDRAGILGWWQGRAGLTPVPPSHTLLLREMVRQETFKKNFIHVYGKDIS
jgi:hypothetical protein